MAVTGGVTTAYVCWMEDGVLKTRHTMILRSACASKEEAPGKLLAGERITVKGSDMATLRTRLAEASSLARAKE